MPTDTDTDTTATYTPNAVLDPQPVGPYTWADLLQLASDWGCSNLREDARGDVWGIDGTPGEMLIGTRD